MADTHCQLNSPTDLLMTYVEETLLLMPWLTIAAPVWLMNMVEEMI